MSHPMTDDQKTLRKYVTNFAKRHGWESWAPNAITPGEDRVEADEVFCMLETPHALYLFSMQKDCPSHIDEFVLHGESATLAMLALARLGVTRPVDCNGYRIDREVDGRWIAEWSGVLVYGDTERDAVYMCADIALEAGLFPPRIHTDADGMSYAVMGLAEYSRRRLASSPEGEVA